VGRQTLLQPTKLVDAARSMRQGLSNGSASVCLSVCLSVCPIYRSLHAVAAGLLLWSGQVLEFNVA